MVKTCSQVIYEYVGARYFEEVRTLADEATREHASLNVESYRAIECTVQDPTLCPLSLRVTANPYFLS
ncbi:MAG: hypothetical protein P0119_04175 [Nitrospira sp.]|nr:hypothetical protein [Nitrospira sp.]